MTVSSTEATTSSNKQSNAQEIVNDAVQIVHEVRHDPRFFDLMKQAKGVFILPTLVRGALVVGGEGGQGVLLSRGNGTWSDPAFLSVGSISVGAQAGGKAGPVVMLLLTKRRSTTLLRPTTYR